MHFISRKIENRYVVWFEQSNRWVQFEEPAWYVNKLYQKGFDYSTISQKCAKKYKLNKDECLHFVKTICESVNEFSQPNPVKVPYFQSIDNTVKDIACTYSTRYYLIGGKRLVIRYNTRLAEYYIHAPLAHLEVDLFLGISDEKFEIHSQGNIQILKKGSNKKIIYSSDDYSKLKRRIFIEIANTIYNRTSNDWFSFVHASALTDGKQSLLLSSSSGSGKSSMAALLQARGLQVISDDFVPIDVKSKRAFPFPAAISVKRGAFSLLSPYYDILDDNNNSSFEYSHKSIRYLTPKDSKLPEMIARPVKNIVFLKYNPQVQCEFRQLPLLDALKLFHEQAWVSGNPEHARIFINWFVKLRCFNLEYGNTEKGIDKILGIFED